jgi:hypothetical protein
MGIRIHVCLGYGLTDVESSEYSIIDSRFNELGYFFADEVDKERFWTAPGYISFCRTLPDDVRPFTYIEALRKTDENLRTREWSPNNSLVYSAEYGLSNVFLIMPPGAWNWFRHDDIIDYTMEVHINKNPTNYTRDIPGGIWPWSSSYMDIRDPERRIDSRYILAINRITDHWKTLNEDFIDTRSLVGGYTFVEKLSKKLGFKGYFDMVDNLNARIPEDIVALCKYLLLFNEEETVYTLKPMLYVWWG